MIDVPREFWGRPEAFQRYLEAQGLSSKKNLDVSQFRAPDIDKGFPNIEPRLLVSLEKPRTKPVGYVRDFAPVAFEPNPFPPQPVSTVRWRGRAPGCPTITMVCNSISASKSKCGFLHDGKYYRVRNHINTPATDCPPSGACCCASPSGLSECAPWPCNTYYDNSSYLKSYVLTTTSHCETGDPNEMDYENVTIHSYTYCDCLGDCATGCASGATCIAGFPAANPPPSIYWHDCTTVTTTYTYDNEYTTAQLKTNTEDALPAYADCFDCNENPDDGCSNLIAGQNCYCSAYANLSTDETSYTIQRFKYKFKFPNPGTDGYLKILWNETFKPTLSAGVTYCGSSYATGAEDPDPAHWTTSAMSEVFGSGDTESSEHEVTEPSSNGTIYVTDIRWTKTEGCEPDASSIEGVDQFASNTSDTYLCNDRDPADKNCTCPA